ncbi:hypothetical protein EV122DRAFT_261049 [Schizophyllum commune]
MWRRRCGRRGVIISGWWFSGWGRKESWCRSSSRCISAGGRRRAAGLRTRERSSTISNASSARWIRVQRRPTLLPIATTMKTTRRWRSSTERVHPSSRRRPWMS